MIIKKEKRKSWSNLRGTLSHKISYFFTFTSKDLPCDTAGNFYNNLGYNSCINYSKWYSKIFQWTWG